MLQLSLGWSNLKFYSQTALKPHLADSKSLKQTSDFQTKSSHIPLKSESNQIYPPYDQSSKTFELNTNKTGTHNSKFNQSCTKLS